MQCGIIYTIKFQAGISVSSDPWCGITDQLGGGMTSLEERQIVDREMSD